MSTFRRRGTHGAPTAADEILNGADCPLPRRVMAPVPSALPRAGRHRQYGFHQPGLRLPRAGLQKDWHSARPALFGREMFHDWAERRRRSGCRGWEIPNAAPQASAGWELRPSRAQAVKAPASPPVGHSVRGS